MALGIIGSFAATAVADDSSALIDALVKKGVLKTKEAEQIRAQIAKSGSHSSAGKLDLDSSVKSLALSGDVRVRYQYQSKTDATPDTKQEMGYGLRLRINADYKLSDDFFAGFGLRTGNDLKDDNTGMANGFSDHNIGIHRAFLGWNPTPGVTLIAGKQANPFYTTDLVWDEDINPSGFSQKIDLNKTLGVSGIDLTLVSGQFVVADNTEYDPNHHQNRDAFLWQTQLIAGIELGGGAKLTIAPGYLSTNGATTDSNRYLDVNDDSTDDITKADGYIAGTSGFTFINPATGLPVNVAGTAPNFANVRTNRQNTLNDVQVLLLPGDISGEVAGIKAKFEWDFAYNFAGRDRAFFNDGVANPRSTDKLSWLLGVRLGENKKKGDWSAFVNYRRVGVGTANILRDNEFADGESNMQGVKVGGAYSLGDSATVGVNYFRFNQIRSEAPYTGIGFDKGDLLQLEVGVKF